MINQVWCGTFPGPAQKQSYRRKVFGSAGHRWAAPLLYDHSHDALPIRHSTTYIYFVSIQVNYSTYWKFCKCRTRPWRRGLRSWPWLSCASCWAAGGAAACAAAWKAASRRLGCRTCPTSSGFSEAMSSSSPTTKHGLTSPSSHLQRERKEEKEWALLVPLKIQLLNSVASE